ncbi:MAG: hypothetical protein IJU56_03615 [Clostridia bacterium]|nr:hypothetical protein [Clostridia bacterium]
MKRCLSLFLALLLLLSAAVVPTTAAYEFSVDLPVINIRGNAQSIVDEDGVVVYDFDPSEEAVKACAKRVLPLLLKGFVTNNFDEYYRAFGEEMTKIYYHCQLDENGDPQWGTGIGKEDQDWLAECMQHDWADENGRYEASGRTYNFDWRLDPLESVDGLNEFINAILVNSGKKKVNLYCNCLGGELLLAYLVKYGADKINAFCFTETVAFGSELVDDTFSGRMNVDPNAIVRFIGDDFMADEMKEQPVLRTFLNESIILAKQTGVLDGVTTLFMRTLYDKLYEGLTPELCLATFGTWPGYWTLVTKEHYAETKQFIFGKPGSERFEKYAGLIQKLDNWDKQVRQRIPALLQGAMDNGAKLGITVRYGYQFPPVLQSSNLNGDVWVSAKNASLGATVSDIGTTLPESYRARRKAEGFGNYLSPDGQIDASTCAFPEQTWFVKGAVHNQRGVETKAFWAEFLNYDGMPTVSTFEQFPQFLVSVRRPVDSEEPIFDLRPMTEENMHTETYEVDAKEKTFFEKLKFFFEHVRLWFAALVNLLKK